MKPLGSVAAVIAAIREDAAVEVDGIIRQADADVAGLRAEDAAHLITFPEGDMQIAAARERSRSRLAQEDWLDTRAAIDEREAWLARAVDLGRQRLDDAAAPAVRRQRLARLTKECLERLPLGALELIVSAGDASLLDDSWRAALMSPAELLSLTVVPGNVDGGCIVRTADGRASFDNSYPARADRLRTAWRAALAKLYERAVQTPPSTRGSGGDRS